MGLTKLTLLTKEETMTSRDLSIFNTLRQYAHCMIVQDLKEALIEAVKFSKDDDCVLFSPACSSLDMFKDYKDRGETFKRLIKDLNDE